MSSKETSNRLNGKDLMNVGIFTAVFLVIEIIVACVLGVFPMGFLTSAIICKKENVTAYEFGEI